MQIYESPLGCSWILAKSWDICHAAHDVIFMKMLEIVYTMIRVVPPAQQQSPPGVLHIE